MYLLDLRLTLHQEEPAPGGHLADVATSVQAAVGSKARSVQVGWKERASLQYWPRRIAAKSSFCDSPNSSVLISEGVSFSEGSW